MCWSDSPRSRGNLSVVMEPGRRPCPRGPAGTGAGDVVNHPLVLPFRRHPAPGPSTPGRDYSHEYSPRVRPQRALGPLRARRRRPTAARSADDSPPSGGHNPPRALPPLPPTSRFRGAGAPGLSQPAGWEAVEGVGAPVTRACVRPCARRPAPALPLPCVRVPILGGPTPNFATRQVKKPTAEPCVRPDDRLELEADRRLRATAPWLWPLGALFLDTIPRLRGLHVAQRQRSPDRCLCAYAPTHFCLSNNYYPPEENYGCKPQ